jgi:hypothetical protein
MDFNNTQFAETKRNEFPKPSTGNSFTSARSKEMQLHPYHQRWQIRLESPGGPFKRPGSSVFSSGQ